MFELYLRLINLLQCTGQIVRENIHDDTKYLIIFKGISFTDSSLDVCLSAKIRILKQITTTLTL